ncbi:MAG: SAM-dependent methyltransferase [Sulfolobales archaeon]|nr:SAM-dependent methyltransferase [Sulfolobales archaeon]
MNYVIVVHLEPCISPWMLCEYRYLSQLFEGRVIYTNVRSGKDVEVLRKYGNVYSEDFTQVIKNLELRDVIILDPKAEEPLRRDELIKSDAVIIGGIMGDHPPRGRTSELITNKAKHLKARNLGPKQFTIAGVAYVIKELEGGKELKDIPVKEGIEVRAEVKGIEVVVELPYAFPVKDGQPVLPKDYVDTIIRRSQTFEENPCAGD